jgi:hypothetical protein
MDVEEGQVVVARHVELAIARVYRRSVLTLTPSIRATSRAYSRVNTHAGRTASSGRFMRVCTCRCEQSSSVATSQSDSDRPSLSSRRARRREKVLTEVARSVESLEAHSFTELAPIPCESIEQGSIG